MRFRYSGKSYVVFLEGKLVADYQTLKEAMDHARSLAERGDSDQQPGLRDGEN
jgi:hypothetical protein